MEGSIEERGAQFIVDLGVDSVESIVLDSFYENLWDRTLDLEKVALAFNRLKKIEEEEGGEH